MLESIGVYAGALDYPIAPYKVDVTGDGESLVALLRKSSATTDGFSHIRLGSIAGDFVRSQCYIPFDLDSLNSETQQSLAPYRGDNPTSGIAPITALSSGQSYFSAAQTSGFYLSYMADQNATCDINMDTFNNGTRMDFTNYFSALSFGGSPRFCQDGPCLSANGSDCNPNNQEFLDNCAGNTPGIGNVTCTTQTCNLEKPGKAGGIAISQGGLCSILTNTFGNELETLIFQNNSRVLSDRKNFPSLGEISLEEQGPELVEVNRRGQSVVVSTNNAITCQVVEDPEARRCSFSECRSTCHESFKNASALAVLNDEGHFLIADKREERVHLFSPDGQFLSSWPESREDESIYCGLTDVVAHPTMDLAVLVYRDSNQVVVLKRSGTRLLTEFEFNTGHLDSLRNPVSGDIAVHGDDSNIYIAAEGSGKVLRFQHWPHNPAVNYRQNLPEDLAIGLPPASGNGVCLTESSFMCGTQSSDQDPVCLTGGGSSLEAILGGVFGGITLGSIFVCAMIPVVYVVNKHCKKNEYSPNSGTVTNLEMKSAD